MAKVLAGVRVLEHGTFITGPAAAMLLGDLGADVVKVEQPAGDPFRAFRGGSYSPHYQTYNRNKKSVRLDTRQPGDLAHFERLVAEAVEKVLPGITGRDLPLNVSAAIPAVLLDVGFPAEALKGVPILARTAGLIGHLTEELAQPIGFALSYQASRDQRYTGTLPPGVTLKKME